MQRDDVDDDDDCPTERPCASYAGYRSPNDEDGGVRSGTADRTADLEKGNGEEEDALGVVEGVDTAEEKLEPADREHVGRPIPAHVAEGVEVIGDGGDGGGDDGAVEGDEEEGEVEGRDDGDEGAFGGVCNGFFCGGRVDRVDRACSLLLLFWTRFRGGGRCGGMVRYALGLLRVLVG